MDRNQTGRTYEARLRELHLCGLKRRRIGAESYFFLELPNERMMLDSSQRCTVKGRDTLDKI